MSTNPDQNVESFDVGTLAEKKQATVGEYIRNSIVSMRNGELGALPMIIGVIILAIIFQTLNENFLTPRNFVNLIVQMGGLMTIAIGVVFVLLLGEIDLSIGYVGAVAAVVMTLFLRPPNGWPWFAAVLVALLLAAFIGIVQGSIITRFQLPSFVVTLAGLLVWNGVVLILIGGAGTVIIQDKIIIGVANFFFPNAWAWVVVLVGLFAFVAFRVFGHVNRKNSGVSTTPSLIVALQIIILVVLAAAVVYVATQDRGIPMLGIIMLILLIGFTFLAERTQFGRYVYAIGGSAEAARRAGINVNRIRVMVFMISSIMAAMGGIVLASRLRSVDTAAGGGNIMLNAIAAAVIGGTSLFGGSGRVSSAFWGALVIATIENGMGLIGLSSGQRFIITGIVLLLAVLVDALSRRSRAQSGRA